MRRYTSPGLFFLVKRNEFTSRGSVCRGIRDLLISGGGGRGEQNITIRAIAEKYVFEKSRGASLSRAAPGFSSAALQSGSLRGESISGIKSAKFYGDSNVDVRKKSLLAGRDKD